MENVINKLYAGGSYLIAPVGEIPIFTAEDFTEEQRMYGKTAEDFVNNTVITQQKAIEAHEPGLMPKIIKQAGELGLLMMDIPEVYGGLELDKATSMLINEKLSVQGSFMVSLGAHTGIGSLPIVFFGNEEQKQKYLPKLATGELIAAYALTEPGSGSDALGAKTKAVLSEDKKYYILNGVKQFITNAGFADVTIVFAKVNGEQFTGFIVEKNFPGFSVGPEEKKLGLRGSSTCQIILEDCKVPVENVLGEVGKGHKIAFNILNVGRFKLGVGCVGGAKLAIEQSVKYAGDRSQFQKPLTSFGAIQDKIARMTTLTYVLEAMSYRIAGCMDTQISGLPEEKKHEPNTLMKIIEDYAIEDSIAKVVGSETLAMVIDESFQIFGGYGFTEEYPIELPYRDNRVNRIFEGTNEINRMLIPGMIFRKAMRGELDLMTPATRVSEEVSKTDIPVSVKSGPLEDAIRVTELSKKAALFTLYSAVKKYAEGMQNEQELLLKLADILSDIFGMDSVLCRVQQLLEKKGEQAAEVQIAIAKAFVADAQEHIQTLVRRLIPSLSPTKEDAEKTLKFLAPVFPYFAFDTISANRLIAKRIIDDGGKWRI